MLVRLTSKSCLVIPKKIRESLRLEKGNQLRLQVTEGRIILEPLSKDAVHRLYGNYAGYDLLDALEHEHRQEKK